MKSSTGVGLPSVSDPNACVGGASHILENPVLNGEVIRLDGALRMAPR